MLLTTYSPQRVLNKNLFDFFANDAAYKSTWQPAVDINENEQAFVLTVDVPGVADDNLSINAENNVLKITGKRESVTTEQEQNVHRVERSTGEFKRTFSLPENINADAISAQKKDGVLTIEIPKKAKEQAKKIEIKFN